MGGTSDDVREGGEAVTSMTTVDEVTSCATRIYSLVGYRRGGASEAAVTAAAHAIWAPALSSPILGSLHPHRALEGAFEDVDTTDASSQGDAEALIDDVRTAECRAELEARARDWLRCGPPWDVQSVSARLADGAGMKADVHYVRRCLELTGLAPVDEYAMANAPKAIGNMFEPTTLLATCMYFDASPREVEQAIAPLFGLLTFLRKIYPRVCRHQTEEEDMVSILAHACGYWQKLDATGQRPSDSVKEELVGSGAAGLQTCVGRLCNLIYIADIFVEDKHLPLAYWRHHSKAQIKEAMVMPLLLELDFKLRLADEAFSQLAGSLQVSR